MSEACDVEGDGVVDRDGQHDEPEEGDEVLPVAGEGRDDEGQQRDERQPVVEEQRPPQQQPGSRRGNVHPPRDAVHGDRQQRGETAVEPGIACRGGPAGRTARADEDAGCRLNHRGAAVDAALKKAVCLFRSSPAQSLV